MIRREHVLEADLVLKTTHCASGGCLNYRRGLLNKAIPEYDRIRCLSITMFSNRNQSRKWSSLT